MPRPCSSGFGRNEAFEGKLLSFEDSANPVGVHELEECFLQSSCFVRIVDWVTDGGQVNQVRVKSGFDGGADLHQCFSIVSFGVES